MKRNRTLKWLGFFALVLLLVLPVLMFSGCKKCEKEAETPPVVEPEEPKTYTVTYAGVEGAENPNTAATFTAEDGAIALADPVKEGFLFEGWTYQGEAVTAIDGAWAQDVTLVAHWSDHYCHIEFEWDLDERYRSYFLNEPFSASFYLQGRLLSVAPKVILVYGANYERMEIPYNSGNYLSVEGFDSKTVGVKHVTFDVHGILDGNTKTIYNATKTYDFEVKDYDHELYGYEIEPEDLSVVWPNGYTLAAKAKHEDWVVSYNWMSSVEAEDHADACSEQSYKPYEFYKGESAFTNTFRADVAYDATWEQQKLLVVYEDMTRVYTRQVRIDVDFDGSYSGDGIVLLPDCVLKKGETIDLAAHNLGTGTISFAELVDPTDGKKVIEFTFTNVNLVNGSIITDGLRTSTGFQYFYTTDDEMHIRVKLVGSNSIVNTYQYQGTTGTGLNIQHVGSTENNADVIIYGEGSLHFTSGGPCLYVTCPLTIDTEVTFASYVGRMTNAINANAIRLTNNAVVRGTNNGTGLLAMRGHIWIEEGAKVELTLATPRIKGTYANLNAIQAAGDLRIESKNVLISVQATPELYEQFEGVDACAFLTANSTLVLDGANVTLNIFASNGEDVQGVFGQVVGIFGGSVYVQNSTVRMNLNATLFNSVYAVYAVNTIEITDSDVDIDLHCTVDANGLFCGNGNIAVIRSNVSVKGNSTFVSDLPNFGVYTGYLSALEVIDSKLEIDFNHSIAVACYLDLRATPAFFPDEDAYTPTVLADLPIDPETQAYGLCSFMAEEGGFDTFETIYDLTASNLAPATRITIDTRK